jgi:hypothetical protein
MNEGKKNYSGRPCPFRVRNALTGEWVADIRCALRNSADCAARMPTRQAAEGAAAFVGGLTGDVFEVVEDPK